MDLDQGELEILANRITQETRAYNAREGLGPETDTLPKRFFKEKTAEGAALSREDLEIMVSEYNRIRDERSQVNHTHDHTKTVLGKRNQS